MPLHLLDVAAGSPVTVDAPALDAASFWHHATSDSDDLAAFDFPEPSLLLKPVDLQLGAMALPDEDAWLFGEKPEIAIGEVQVVASAMAAATTTATPAALDGPVHTDDDVTTSVLLEPILGGSSPVDELDAMAAFMVDHVDPFQEVIVTSDEEMSPRKPHDGPRRAHVAPGSGRNAGATGPAPTAVAAAAGAGVVGPDAYGDTERRLERLRAKVDQLDKMYYARCHGRSGEASTSMADVDVHRVKLIRTIERNQRVMCGIAQDNYGLRLRNLSRARCDELFLHDMRDVLYGPAVLGPLSAAIEDKLCADVIVRTARRVTSDSSNPSVAATSATTTILGWEHTKHITPSGVLSFSAKKEFPQSLGFDAVAARTWELLVAADKFASFATGSAKFTRSCPLKRLSDDALVIAFDSVVGPDEGRYVERDVCVVFRVSSPAGVMLGVCSLPPSMWARKLHELETVRVVNKGMRWIQLARRKVPDGGFAVAIGGHMQTASPATAEGECWEALGWLSRWENTIIGPVFQL